MSRALLVLALLAFGSGLRPTHAAKPLTVKDLLAVKWVSGVTIAPDGQRAAFVVSEAARDENKRHTSIYIAATGGPARAVRRLTSAPGMNTAPVFSPDGRRIAFVSSRGGGDEPQLWVIPVDGGEATQLTKISTGAGRPVWSPDGKLIAFGSSVFPDCKDDACNAQRLEAQSKSKVKAQVFDALLIRHWNHWRDERRSHVLVVAAEPGAKPRDLTPGPADAPPISLGSYLDYVFSPDGKKLAYVSNTDKVVATSTNNDVFEVPVSGGRPVRISTGPGNDYSPRYSPDGRRLAYLSMARPGYESDYPRLIVRDRRTGQTEQWATSFADHALELAWGADSQRLYFNAPHRGFVELFAARGQELVQLTQGAYAKSPSLSADGRVLVFSSEAANRPAEVWALALAGGRAQGAPRQLTALNEWLPPQAGLQRAEHIWYESDGGAKIHAVLIKPPGFVAGRRYPAVVMLHGGPQGMTGDDFHPRWNLQMLAARGYVVFGPNFHGSEGFGQRFTDAIRGDWGGQPYRDVLRGVEHLAKLPFVDGQRIAAVGASYGGYLVNWIATQTQRFRCLISHAGLFNMESKYGSTEELWFPEWEFKGTPWTNRALYRRWSPHGFADQIRTPMLVVHGQNDFRVPVEQAFQLFTTLQRRGVPSRLLYFPDEDHFVQKPQNVELWWKTMHDWLDRYLQGGR